MRNTLDPELLSGHERLTEVGALLARGLLRRRVRAAARAEKHLAISLASSHSCPEPSPAGGET